MRQLILVVAVWLGMSFGASAQSLVMQIAPPDRVMRQDCAMVSDPASVCNSGDEPFSEFLSRFCADMDFQKTRLRGACFSSGSDDGDGAEYLGMMELQMLQSEGPLSFVPFFKRDACSETLATWYGVDADRALFQESYIVGRDPGCAGNASAGEYVCFWVFERKGGKWYLTDLLQVG